MRNLSVTTQIVVFTKCDPWSLIRTLGKLECVSTLSNKKCMEVTALQSFNGVAYAHWVKHFVMVIMYHASSRHIGGLIGLIKSMVHLSNSSNDNMGERGISSRYEDFPTLWKIVHDWKYNLESKNSYSL